MTRTKRLVIAVAGLLMLGQVGAFAQKIVYYSGAGGNYPDQLLMSQSGACTIDGGGRLPLDSSVPNPHSSKAFRIKWKTGASGSWSAYIRQSGNAIKDISAYDSLCFYVYAPVAIADSLLPNFYLEDNASTPARTTLRLSKITGSIPAQRWVRVSVAVPALLAQGTAFNSTKLRYVGFTGSVRDNVEHTLLFDNVYFKKQLPAPTIKTKGYGVHAEVLITPSAAVSGSFSYEIYRSTDGGKNYTFVKQVASSNTEYMDWVGKTVAPVDYTYKVRAVGTDAELASPFSNVSTSKVYRLTDDELMDMTEEHVYNFYTKYRFTKYGMMAPSITRYGWGQMCVGTTSMMFLVYMVAYERNFDNRDTIVNRIQLALNTMLKLRTWNGLYSNYYSKDDMSPMNYNPSEKEAHVSVLDNGHVAVSMVALRQYFKGNNAREKAIRDSATKIFERINFRKAFTDNGRYGYALAVAKGDTIAPAGQLPNRGFMECMSSNYMGMSAPNPNFALPDGQYDMSWGGLDSPEGFTFCKSTYHHGRYLSATNTGLTAAFTYQRPFQVLDPRHLSDRFCNDYYAHCRRSTLDQYEYAIKNEKGLIGVSDSCWGHSGIETVMVVNPDGTVKTAAYYGGHMNNYIGGTVSTSVLGNFAYAPDVLKKPLRYFYEVMGKDIFTYIGYWDGFYREGPYYNAPRVVKDITAIHYSTILTGIENYRSQLFWNLLKNDPDVKRGLERCGLRYNVDTIVPTLPSGMLGWYKADQGVEVESGKVTGWKDQSGNGYDFTAVGAGNITLKESSINGYPALAFENSNNSFSYLKSSMPVRDQKLSAYMVVKLNGTSGRFANMLTATRSGVAKADADSSLAILFQRTSSGSNVQGVRKGANGTDINYPSVAHKSANTFAYYGIHFGRDAARINVNAGEARGQAGTGNKGTIVDSVNRIEGRARITSIPTHRSADFNVGEMHLGATAGLSGADYCFDGEVAELIIFDQNKFTQGLDKHFATYFSLKYGIAPNMDGAHDCYHLFNTRSAVIWDGSYGYGYNRNISGIGRDDNMFGLNQRKSINSKDILGFSLGKSLADTAAAFTRDMSFVIWGCNDSSATTYKAMPVNGYNGTQASKRMWRLLATNMPNQKLTLTANIKGISALSDTSKVGVILSENKDLSNGYLLKGEVVNDSIMTVGNINLGNERAYFLALASTGTANGQSARVLPDTVAADTTSGEDDFWDWYYNGEDEFFPNRNDTTLNPNKGDDGDNGNGDGDNTTAVAKSSASNQNFMVYPNPVSSTLYVRQLLADIQGEVTRYIIRSVTGKVILQGYVNVGYGQQEASISSVGSLPDGMYFIQLLNSSNKTQHITRFLKQR